MGAGHGHHLHFHGHSLVHRLPSHVKLVTLLTYVVAVVLTPRTAYWAYGVHLLLVLVSQRASRVPFPYFAKRMLVETPFVVFALLVPFVATGPKVSVGPLELSEQGLVSGWALLAKGTLGVMASLVVATTTEPRHVVAGLEKLRLPNLLVQIMGFMVRYLEVVTAELARMRIARESRGFRARSFRAWPALASTAGALFIRSYERGERVHLAMLSRGYQGQLPVTHPLTATSAQWRVAGAIPALAVLTLAAAVAL